MPIISPSPRTSRTPPWSAAARSTPARRRAPIRVAFSISPPSMSCMVTAPAAAQIGLPAKVDPWAPTGQDMTDARATKAPIGIPDAIPLAVVTMSGSTPACSIAHQRPPAPGAPHPRLDLVGDQQDAVLVADLPEPTQEGGGGGKVAAFALDRLDDDGRHVARRDEATPDAAGQHLQLRAAVAPPPL